MRITQIPSIELLDALVRAGYANWSNGTCFVRASAFHTDVINGMWGVRTNDILETADPEYFARVNKTHLPPTSVLLVCRQHRDVKTALFVGPSQVRLFVGESTIDIEIPFNVTSTEINRMVSEAVDKVYDAEVSAWVSQPLTQEERNRLLNGMWGVYGVPSQPPPPPPRKPIVSGERLARTCARCKSHRVHAAIRPETTEMIAICKLCGHEADL